MPKTGYGNSTDEDLKSEFENEEVLIRQLLAQDEVAYRYVVKTYHASMVYLARRIVGETVAGEVVQEAWLSVMGALPKFEGRSKLKSWILTIVSNEAKNRLRKEKRYVSLESMSEDTSGITDRFDQTNHWASPAGDWQADSPDALLSGNQLSSCLNQAISELPALQEATLSLKEKQGYSLKEICNILDVSDSNVRVLLHRARNKVFTVIDHFQLTGECCTETTPA
ncbi:MAG: RNA polymerase sigma-70 factor (ECF subfamily) [Candidatus Azotimanducaceae bacterium]|jgi:RNA polymerase sigma-70 factor (ECF subfamily)